MSTVRPFKAPEVAEVIDRAAAPRQARLVLTRLLDAHPELADRLGRRPPLRLRPGGADRRLPVAVGGGHRRRRAAGTARRPRRPGRRVPPRRLHDPGPPRRWPTTRGPRSGPAPLEAPAAAAHRRAGPPGPGRPAGRGPGAGLAGRGLPPGGAGAGPGRRSPTACGWPSSAWASSAAGSSTTRATSTCSSSTTATAPPPSGIARNLLTTMAQPTPDGIVFRTDADLRPEGRAGPLSRSLDAYRAYWEQVGADVGVPGAHQGPAGRRRRRPRRGVPRGGRAPRVAGPARPRRRPGGPHDEGAGRGGGVEAGPDGAGDQAGPRGPPRHRVRRAAAPARPRPPRPGDPLPQHARGPRPARPGGLRRHRPRSARLDAAYRFLRTVEHRLQLRRRAAGPRPPGRRRRAAPGWPGSSATATRAGDRPRTVRDRPPPPPGPGALDPREALLPAPARGARRHRPALPGGGRGAAGRLRLPRRGPHPGRPGAS